MTELLPCPFCGGEALLEEGGMFDLVVCKNSVDCGAEGPYGRDCEEAISAWNTRPAPSPSDAGCLGCDWEADTSNYRGPGSEGPAHTCNPEAPCTCKAPSPSREGWLDAETIEKWRISFKMTYTTRGHEELNALCDMALSALRPAGDEGCLEPCECGEAWGHCKCAAPATKPTIHRDSAPDGCKWVTETKEDK